MPQPMPIAKMVDEPLTLRCETIKQRPKIQLIQPKGSKSQKILLPKKLVKLKVIPDAQDKQAFGKETVHGKFDPGTTPKLLISQFAEM